MVQTEGAVGHRARPLAMTRRALRDVGLSL